MPYQFDPAVEEQLARLRELETRLLAQAPRKEERQPKVEEGPVARQSLICPQCQSEMVPGVVSVRGTFWGSCLSAFPGSTAVLSL